MIKFVLGHMIGLIFFLGGSGIGFLLCNSFTYHVVTYLIMVIFSLIFDLFIGELLIEGVILIFYSYRRNNHCASNTGISLIEYRNQRVLYP